LVLGDPELGYTGQPDKIWLMMNRAKTEFGFVVTDWKTNKKKNFQETGYTKRLKDPFGKFPDTALGHYYLQLPLYAKLLLKMLQGTKYADVKLLGCVITHLSDEAQFEEYRVPQEIVNTVLDMDVKKYLITKK
jgi:hypothetical protein